MIVRMGTIMSLSRKIGWTVVFFIFVYRFGIKKKNVDILFNETNIRISLKFDIVWDENSVTEQSKLRAILPTTTYLVYS